MNRNPRNLPEVGPDDKLDLSELRRHMREMHPQVKIPRSNKDASSTHARWHHRFGGHHHQHIDSQFVLIVNRAGMTQERWLGWFTGQGAVLRDEINRRFREKINEPHHS